MNKSFLKWIKKEIKKREKNIRNEFDKGYVAGLEDVETQVQYGIFNDIIYVKLKSEYSVKNLNYKEEYEAHSAFGGEYLKIINDEGIMQYYERFKFDVLRIYNPYEKKFITKDDINKISEKMNRY